jgi:hypothetical protein
MLLMVMVCLTHKIQDRLDGADRIYRYSDGTSVSTIDAGTGNDEITVYAASADAQTTVTGGDGRDLYWLQPGYQGSFTITDFAAGTDGDLLQIDGLLNASAGYSSGNPFDPTLGYLRLVQQGSDTLLQWDQDGSANNTNSWQTVVTLQNLDATSVSRSNFIPSTSITTTTVVVGNAPPSLLQPLPDQQVDEGQMFAYSVPGGSFVDPGEVLAFAALQADGSALPSWLSFDPATQTFSGTPAQADIGTIEIRVTATDGGGLSASDVFTLVINNVNDAPTTSPVTLTAIAEDSGARLITQAQLLANAADIDSAILTATSLQITAGSGSLVNNGNGTWSYNPALNDDTQVSFSYSISDGQASVAGSATLDITPVNDVPTTSPVTLSAIAEDSGARLITQAQLLANAADVDSALLTATNLQISAGGGSLINNGNGTWSYTPALNDDTQVSFSYSIGDGQATVPGSATLDITPVNDAPVAVADVAATLLNTPIIIAVVANDSDVDVGDVLTVTAVTNGAHGTVTIDPVTGNPRYAPAAGYIGVDSFTYTVSDGHGGSQ